MFLHRKGAAPSDEGLVVIPGSRGAYSYLVSSINSDQHHASGFSLAHGAGRAVPRSKTNKIKEKFSKKAGNQQELSELLLATSFNSAVICEDNALLVEEHQDAYKSIDAVVGDLVEFGLIKIVARFRPLLTYKTRNE